jgi:outer membrane protein assembly factor BamD (BamD/ComL family)
MNMKKTYCINIIITLVLISYAVVGCVPETRKVVVDPEPYPLAPPPLPADKIDERIAALSRFLEEQKGSEDEKETAKTLLDTYRTIKKASKNPSMPYDYREVIKALFNNLSALDEQYFLREKSERQLDAQVLNRFGRERGKIMNLYFDGDYQGVINQCLELEASYGPDSLTPEIGLLFSFSLAERGLFKEAVNIGGRIVRQLEGKPDLMLLRANLIEWQLELGKKEDASRIYEKLTDDIQDKEAIFKQAEKKLHDKDTKTALSDLSSPGSENIETDVWDKGTIKEVLREVDRLIKQHEFQSAKILLIKRRLTLEEGPDVDTVDQALESVDLAEDKYQKEVNTSMLQKKQTLNSAIELIEEEKFEEAITKLEAFERSQEMTPETGRLKGFAVDKLINRERNKAAKLFLMAKNTEDPIQKEELLVSSYDLLKALVDDYPSSPLNDKINDHMNKIRRELDKLKEGSD